MTYSSTDEADAALASGEAVLGCDGVQLQQLLLSAEDDDLATPTVQVMD